MSITSSVIFVGNLTADPKLRFTKNGTAVASVNIASTERVFDRTTNQWRDGDTTFIEGSVWKNSGGENVAESLVKGSRVIAMGRLKQRSYVTDDGNKRTVMEMEIEEIGPSLRYATAAPVRAQRASAQPADNSWQNAPADAGIPF